MLGRQPHGKPYTRKHQVVLQRPAEAVVDGEVQRGWIADAMVWAEVVDVSSRERREAEQLGGQVTRRLHIRKASATGINERWRIVWGERIMQVVGLKEVGHLRNWWEIDVREAT